GRLLKQAEDGGEQWDVISLPALAEGDAETQGRGDTEKDLSVSLRPALSPSDPLGRLAGEALWPERFPVEYLLKLKRQMGTYSFESLYQQRPTPPEGMLFKRDWFKNKIVDHAPR